MRKYKDISRLGYLVAGYQSLALDTYPCNVGRQSTSLFLTCHNTVEGILSYICSVSHYNNSTLECRSVLLILQPSHLMSVEVCVLLTPKSFLAGLEVLHRVD